MSPLQIGSDAVATIVTDVARYGALGVETGALLLTPPGQATVTLVALAGTAGIERRAGLLVFTSAALNPLFSYAEDNGFQVRAQVHSHKHEAFLSKTDKAGNIRMPGFIAAVIPDFATPTSNVATWGWWTFEESDWKRGAPPTVTRLNTKFITFDAGGIHEH